MSTAISQTASKAILIDTTKCIGCRSCQVSCKQWNQLPAENTALLPGEAGIQNPIRLSAKTLTLVTFNEIADPQAPGGLRYIATKRQCMHCDDPACASACPVTALYKSDSGAVTYDAGKCLGCRYCLWACPFGGPTAEWNSRAPEIRKCTMCDNRAAEPPPEERNGQALTDEERKRFAAVHAVPACVKQCPTGALQYSDRQDLLEVARQRIAASPNRYVNHIYGETEAGGTAMLYLASVPFSQLGMPDVGNVSYPSRSVVALGAVPPAVIGVGTLLGATYALQRRKEQVSKAAPAKDGGYHEHHVEFAPLQKKLWTPTNMLLVALMLFGGLSFLLRFMLGLGGSTHLSDTYAWGLWIVFDLVWIAVAAGAFATAGLIYVFQRKDLYSIGRSAVLMGLLSYAFVSVTLLADLGLPWHFWQLGVQAPKHSAMFEVSWCVGLYVTVLAFEFMPVPFERWGMKRFLELWRQWSPAYVVVAVTLFVYLMSRKMSYTGAAFLVFALLAYAFRQRAGEKPVPIMLAIAAVTLSTMHQSSLGSLFLLMPDKLNALWWSPVMPVYFFLSSIAAGLALMVLVEMWIAKAYNRPMRTQQLAALGKVAFGALLVYEALRIGDVVARGQIVNAFGGPKAALFLVEVILGGLVPLYLLSRARWRERPVVLGLGAFLAMGGVILNRASVVIFGMNLKGPMPQNAPYAYSPSIFEWGLSLGLIAATIFLFGWGARLMPVLPKEQSEGQR